MGAGQVWLHCGGLKILRTKFDSLNTHNMKDINKLEVSNKAINSRIM